MKKSIVLLIALSLVLTAASFAQVSAKDGVYFAQDAGFAVPSGWKEQVVVTVKGGKIVSAIWNGVSNLPAAADKRAYDAAGKYNMVKYGKAIAEWNAQAKAVEDFLVKTQDTGFNKYKDAEGRTDAISGATMHVKVFFDLVSKALSLPAVPKGMYKKSGWYFAEQAAFDPSSGWKDSVLITVVNGTIVDVLWNGSYKDATKKSKLVEASEGRYGMAKAAKKGEWNVQAAAVQAALITAQDPSGIKMKADGTSDAISGASIHLTAIPLAITALKPAR